MAGDWMKVEKLTPDKPEIAILARKLGTSKGEAFLNWFRVYSWADGITCPGFVPHLSLEDADELSRAAPGTCAALASTQIGWLSAGDDGIHFRNWERHNGKSAKSRALETEKKREQRSKRPAFVPHLSRICPDDNGTESGPEKRREEKSNKETKGKKNPQFVPPTIEEVRAYCLERKNGIDPETFIAHYEANGWVQGKGAKPVKNWKACITTWEKNRPSAKSKVPSAEQLARWNPVDGGLGGEL